MKKIKFAGLKNFMKGRGFIGALCLSVVAVGIATYVAYDSTLREITAQSAVTPELPAGNDVSGVPKDGNSEPAAAPPAATPPAATPPEESDESGDKPANNFVTAPSGRMMPVKGEIITPYSGGELVKSETLGVWKTHDGIDIACDEGTEVKSAAAGKAVRIYDDPLWGVCVVIDHYDGYQGFYYGLGSDLKIKEQQELEAGDVIGRTAAFDCESKLPPHLHFGVKFSDKWISPEDFVNGQ